MTRLLWTDLLVSGEQVGSDYTRDGVDSSLGSSGVVELDTGWGGSGTGKGGITELVRSN